MSPAPKSKTSWWSLDRWARFRPSGGVYLAEIDGLRFIAITAVICVHITGIWTLNVGRKYPDMSLVDNLLYRITLLGGYGVELFFVISGFVLALPFLKNAHGLGKPVVLGSYLKRRLTRLEPPYVISMIGFFILLPIMGKGTYSDLWPNFVASLLYYHNIAYGTGSVLNNNAWSLEIEVQFYLLVPLLLWFLRKSQSARLAVLSGFVVLSSLHFLWLPATFPKTLLQFMQYFSVGIMVCDIWLARWRTLSRSGLWDLVGIISIILFFSLNLSAFHAAAKVMNPWLFGVFAASALRGKALGSSLSWGVVPILGGMCYSVYLLHARVVSVLLHVVFSQVPLSSNFTIDFALLSLAVVPITFASCAVFYLLIERPCMDPAWPSALMRKIKGKTSE